MWASEIYRQFLFIEYSDCTNTHFVLCYTVLHRPYSVGNLWGAISYLGCYQTMFNLMHIYHEARHSSKTECFINRARFLCLPLERFSLICSQLQSWNLVENRLKRQCNFAVSIVGPTSATKRPYNVVKLLVDLTWNLDVIST